MAMQIFESHSSVFWQTTRLHKDYLEIFFALVVLAQ